MLLLVLCVCQCAGGRTRREWSFVLGSCCGPIECFVEGDARVDSAAPCMRLQESTLHLLLLYSSTYCYYYCNTYAVVVRLRSE